MDFDETDSWSVDSTSATTTKPSGMSTAINQNGPKKIIRNLALKRTKEVVPLNNKVKLERVLGLTVSSNVSLDCDQHTNTAAYPAGCVVVLYNIRKNHQNYILNVSKKPITACKFSNDGKFLVTGECGHMPQIRVWDVNTCEQVAAFPGHKYGINCVAFSPNNKYVVSVGSQHDMIVNVWDWKNSLKIASNKVSSKVKSLSFHSSGSNFVTVGNRHVKFWYLDYSRSSKNKFESLPLMGRSAILGDQRNNYFCDVGCGRGEMSESTYAITKSGLLCEFNNRRLLDKWVELRTTSANCISVTERLICIGCAQGVVRCFDPLNLHFICTLPRPHSLGIDIARGLMRSETSNSNSNAAKYPDTIAITLDEANNTVTCIYSDRSIYFWTISNIKKVGKLHSFLYHSGCIWDVETYPTLKNRAKQLLPPGTFLTCSSDDTIRIWNIESKASQDSYYVYKKNIFSSELLKILYMDPDLSYICDVDISPGGNNDKNTTYDGKNGVRSLRISPFGTHLASGDRSGNIRIFDLEQQQDLCKIEAHDSEVLCLEYSNQQNFGGKSLMASASRDRLIHIFDVNQQYSFLQTMDDHSSSITAVKFVCGQSKKLQMISCGADKSLIFRKGVESDEGFNFMREHHVVGKTTLYDMEVDLEQKNILTACQDRMVRIYDVSTGKNTMSFKGSQGDEGTLIKVALDPSGTFVATSCTDKSLYLYDYQTGESLATTCGHAELVTGLKFSENGKNLISASGDGCVFIWRLPNEMVNVITEKLGLPSVPITPENINVKPFHQNSNNLEDETESNNSANSPTLYRFNLKSLPLWAKKQMAEEVNRTNVKDEIEHNKSPPPIQPKGRWAQRMESVQNLVVKSDSNSDALIPYPSVKSQSIHSKDDQSSDESKSYFSTNGNGRNRHGTDSSSASGSFFPDDDDDMTTTISDTSDMIFSQSESNFGFKINESNNVKPRRFSKNHHRYIGSGIVPSVSVPNFNELHSDDEDSCTTNTESERSTKNPLYMSTENLDRFDQREKYLKQNFENLDNLESETKKQAEKSDYVTSNRNSISAKYLSKTPNQNESETTLTEISSGTSTPSTLAKPPFSKRRIELTKAIAEARKKLETLGYKGSGLSNSKSVANLRDISFDHSNQDSNYLNSTDAIKRSISLSDLSFSPQRKLLPSTPMQINISDSPAPLWDRKSENSSQNELSSKPTNNFANKIDLIKSHSVQFKNKGLWEDNEYNSSNFSGRASAPPVQPRRIRSMNKNDDHSSDDETSSSDLEGNITRARPGTPPKPNLLRQMRRSSTSQSINVKSDNTVPLNKPRKLWANDFLRSTKSEFNLSSLGRETPNRLRNNNSGSSIWERNSESFLQTEKIDLSMTNPSTVPLTPELCQLVINELNSITKYACKIYQRASVMDNSKLCDTLYDGMSEAYDNLNAIISMKQNHSKPSIPNDPNQSLPPENAMLLLQQYSDRLLNMVEQRFKKNSNSNA